MAEFEDVDVDLGTVRDLVLKFLQKKKEPVPMSAIQERLEKKIIGVSEEQIEATIKSLIIDGYDIKDITTGDEVLYVMVRFPEFEEEDMYRIHGRIKTPLIFTSDWHIGSKGFYKIAYNKLVADIEEYGIEDVLIAGDLIQGRGVYSTELSELQQPSLTAQMLSAIKMLKGVGANVHLIAGNHEEKIQGSIHVGLETLRLIAAASDRVKYYGHVAHLELNDKYRVMMLHGAGAATLASTQMIEKIWRSLHMKPHILHMGHNHQLDQVAKGLDKLALNSGTLQRTNAWLLQKGFNAKIGWYILEGIPDLETKKWIVRRPRLN